MFAALVLVAAAANAAPSAEENAQPVAPPPAAPQPATSTPAAESPGTVQTAPTPQEPAQSPAPPPTAPAQQPAQSPSPEQPAASVDFRAKAHEYKSAAEGLHKPTGEITVTADHVEWQTGAMHYTGNVKLTVDTMEMTGADLELKLLEGRLEHAHLTGEPAHMVDAGTEGQQPISAQSKHVDYDPGTNMVELAGAAQLMRGADRLTGDLIRYDVAARRVQAAGGGGSQVKIVIQPPPRPAPPKAAGTPP